MFFDGDGHCCLFGVLCLTEIAQLFISSSCFTEVDPFGILRDFLRRWHIFLYMPSCFLLIGIADFCLFRVLLFAGDGPIWYIFVFRLLTDIVKFSILFLDGDGQILGIFCFVVRRRFPNLVCCVFFVVSLS